MVSLRGLLDVNIWQTWYGIIIKKLWAFLSSRIRITNNNENKGCFCVYMFLHHSTFNTRENKNEKSHTLMFQYESVLYCLLSLTVTICCLPLGCVYSLWWCFQCWELHNSVPHIFLYMFLWQHPLMPKIVALQQHTQPEIPLEKEKPADCLPKEQKIGEIKLDTLTR